jgi:hypothetical protein
MIPPGEEYNTFTAIRDTVDTFLTIILQHIFARLHTFTLCLGWSSLRLFDPNRV